MKTALIIASVAASLTGTEGSGLMWSDWDGAQVCQPQSFAQPASEAEVVQAVRAANAAGSQLKVRKARVAMGFAKRSRI